MSFRYTSWRSRRGHNGRVTGSSTSGGWNPESMLRVLRISNNRDAQNLMNRNTGVNPLSWNWRNWWSGPSGRPGPSNYIPRPIGNMSLRKAFYEINKLKGRIEVKQVDFAKTRTLSATGVESEGGQFRVVMPLIAEITQGAGDGQRIGDKITIKSIAIRYKVIRTNTTNLTPRGYRLMILKDRRANATGSLYWSEFMNVESGSETITDLYDNSEVNRGRWQFLHDESNIQSSDNDGCIVGKNFIKGDFKVLFTGTTLRTNQIFFILFMDNPTDDMSLRVDFRIRYVDM